MYVLQQLLVTLGIKLGYRDVSYVLVCEFQFYYFTGIVYQIEVLVNRMRVRKLFLNGALNFEKFSTIYYRSLLPFIICQILVNEIL